jgi:hypothetical protein
MEEAKGKHLIIRVAHVELPYFYANLGGED